MGSHGGSELICRVDGCRTPVTVSDDNVISSLVQRLAGYYHVSTHAGEAVAQYWGDISVNSKYPLAPLARC
jgi:chorismate synthase